MMNSNVSPLKQNGLKQEKYIQTYIWLLFLNVTLKSYRNNEETSQPATGLQNVRVILHDITEILLKVALKTTDCHDITEILLKVALKTTDCHDITEILLKVALKTTDCHDITEILLKVALKTLKYILFVLFDQQNW
jgi:hypothetical protein